MTNLSWKFTSFLCLGFALGQQAPAATLYWASDTATSDDWSIASNWATNAAGTVTSANSPQSGDNVRINMLSTEAAPVAYGDSASISLGSLTLGDGSTDTGYLKLDAGTLLFASGASTIGFNGVGALTVNSGAVFEKSNGNLNIGYKAAATGTVTVNTGGVFRMSSGNAALNIGGEGVGTFNVFGGSLQLAKGTAANYSVGTNTGTGTLAIRGGVVSAANALDTQTLNIGFSGGAGTGNGTLLGYGLVDMISAENGLGNFQLGGQVIGDGTKVDASVDQNVLSIRYNNLRTADNTPGVTHFGWYTQNQGAIDLEGQAIGGSGHVFWGDDQGNTTFWDPGTANDVLVNSAYSHFVSNTGTLDITLLDSTRTLAVDGVTTLPTAPSGVAFLNIWQLDLGGGDNTIDEFAVRFDEGYSDVNAADLFGDLQGFYYWDGVSGAWTDLTGSTTLDLTNHLASWSDLGINISDGESGFFALGATVPEPATLIVLGFGAFLVAQRRKEVACHGF